MYVKKKTIPTMVALFLVLTISTAAAYEQDELNTTDTAYNLTIDYTEDYDFVYSTLPRNLNLSNASAVFTGYTLSANYLGPSDTQGYYMYSGSMEYLCQRFTMRTHIPQNGEIINFSALLRKSAGSPPGNVNIKILNWSNKGELFTKVLIAANSISTSATWYTETVGLRLTNPETQIIFCVNYENGDSGNHIHVGHLWPGSGAYQGDNAYYQDGGGWGTPGGDMPFRIYFADTDPENVTLDTGDDGGTDYVNDTQFLTSEQIDLNTTAVMDYLRYSCSADWTVGTCDVPFKISSDENGMIEVSTLNLSGEQYVPYANVTLNITYNRGLFPTDQNSTLNVTITDEGYGPITCNITINGNSTISNFTSGDNKQFGLNMLNGENYINVNCTNDMGLSTIEEEYFSTSMVHYILINEETGDPYSITSESIVMFVPAQNLSYNMSDAGVNDVYFVWNDTEEVRFEIEYSGVSGVITRDFDTVLEAGNETRVCVANYQTFYEQILYSSANDKGIALYSVFADCYLLQDYTKFAYSDAFMLRGFTIPTFYYLYVWDTDGNKAVLGELDGGIASEINIDLIEFKQREYTISILGDEVSISAYTNTTIQIYYKDPANLNDKIIVTVKNGSTTLYTYTEHTEPNDVTLYWDHTTQNLTDMLLTLTIDKYTEDELTETITKLFYANGLSGNMNPSVALLISGVLVFFGLTFVAVRYVFGYFGIIIDIVAIAILTQAPANQYIILMEAIITIMLIFKIFLMKEEYAKTAVT